MKRCKKWALGLVGCSALVGLSSCQTHGNGLNGTEIINGTETHLPQANSEETSLETQLTGGNTTPAFPQGDSQGDASAMPPISLTGSWTIQSVEASNPSYEPDQWLYNVQFNHTLNRLQLHLGENSRVTYDAVDSMHSCTLVIPITYASHRTSCGCTIYRLALVTQNMDERPSGCISEVTSHSSWNLASQLTVSFQREFHVVETRHGREIYTETDGNRLSLELVPLASQPNP